MADRYEIAWQIWAWHNRRAGYRFPEKMPEDCWFGLDDEYLTKGERQIRDSILDLASKIVDQITCEPAEEDSNTNNEHGALPVLRKVFGEALYDGTHAAPEESALRTEERVYYPGWDWVRQVGHRAQIKALIASDLAVDIAHGNVS